MSSPVSAFPIQAWLDKVNAPIAIEGAQAYFHERGETAVLVLHGWGATAESMRFLAGGLAAENHSVLAPTLPGHGVSHLEMHKVGPSEWIECARAALDLLRSRYARIYVLGVSMGGALALQLGALEGCGLAGVITVNAPVFLDQPQFALDLMNGAADDVLRPGRDRSLWDPRSRRSPTCCARAKAASTSWQWLPWRVKRSPAFPRPCLYASPSTITSFTRAMPRRSSHVADRNGHPSAGTISHITCPNSTWITWRSSKAHGNSFAVTRDPVSGGSVAAPGSFGPARLAVAFLRETKHVFQICKISIFSFCFLLRIRKSSSLIRLLSQRKSMTLDQGGSSVRTVILSP